MTKTPKQRTASAAPPGQTRRPGAAELLAAELPTGLRARLLERLRDARVPEGHAQAQHLADITGRAYQTTRRWIDEEAPGLPDLASFKLLCQGMDCDPAWLLGLVPRKRSLLEVTVDQRAEVPHGATTKDQWMDGVSRDVLHGMHGCRARRMRGDEMEPEISDGDTIFIDLHVREFDGNGNYLISCDGRELVRRLEYKVGSGLILGCANPRYAPTIIANEAESHSRRLSVLGRIEGVVQVRKFWRQSPGAGEHR